MKETEPFWTKWTQAALQRRFERLSIQAPTLSTEALRSAARDARALNRATAALIEEGARRLSLPAFGASPIHAPYDVLWSWRPELFINARQERFGASLASGARLSDEVELFHDADDRALCWHLERNHRATDLCAWSVVVESFAAEASYISLVINLPSEGWAELNRDRLFRVELSGDAEAVIDARARLTMESGPNTDTLHHDFKFGSGHHLIEFDLIEMDLPGKRVTKAWVDLIFARTGMNSIRLNDLTFMSRPRAQI